MFQCVEYELDDKIVKEVLKTIKKYKGKNCSAQTCTHNGFQSDNIRNLFKLELLKKILPINELYKKIIHIHYIKYERGGYQTQHLHKPDDYSFILYLNDSDGDTVLKDPVNKSFTPTRGKIVVFNGKILHHAEPSFKGKLVLVGAMR